MRSRLYGACASGLLLFLSGCEVFVFFSSSSSQHHQSGLQVVAFTPANGSTAVSTATHVSVAFNESVTPQSAASGILLTSAAGSVAGSVQVVGATAEFTPAAALALGTMYTVTVSTAVMGIDGATLASPVASSFTTIDGAFQQTSMTVGLFCGTASSLVSDGDGNALLTWLASGGAGDVRMARYSSASGWSNIEGLARPATGPPSGNAFRVRASPDGQPADAEPAASNPAAADPAASSESLPMPDALSRARKLEAFDERVQDVAGRGRLTLVDVDRQGNGFIVGEAPGDAPKSLDLSIARVSDAGSRSMHIVSAFAGAVEGFGGRLAILDPQGRAMVVWCDPASDMFMAKKFE